MKAHRLVEFDRFSLDVTAKVLLRDGVPVHLTRKAVETLAVLVESAGQVVTKEEIFEEVWPDRVVEEANLAQNIAVVRKALGAETGSPAWIETFAGRGYRLTGPVVIREIPPGSNGSPTATVDTPVPQARAPWRLVGLAITFFLLAGGWIFYLWRNASQDIAPRVVALTRLPGREFQPALAPDGKRVAFLWEQEAGQPARLCIQSAGQTEPEWISSAGGHYRSPAWGPRGEELAYLHIGTSATEVLVHSVRTGAERTVARLVPPQYGAPSRLLDWSPDGRWLVVSHSDAPGRAAGLFLVSSASGETRRLTDPGLVVGGDLDPRFSPDGRTISFIRYVHRSQQELYSVHATGGPPRQLTNDAKQISSHDWSGDGSSVVFASDRNGEFRLWRVRPGAANGQKPQPLAIYAESPIELSIARKAEVLVYSVLQQDRDIWRLDLEDKQWTRIVASSAQDASPQYSPAGDRICFRSDRSGEEQLWVSDADGANGVQVTRGRLYPSVGHWSPNGRSIVFNNARSGEVFVADQGSHGDWAVRNLGAVGVHPVFSADGKWIFAGTTSAIMRVPSGGGPPAGLFPTPGISLHASPDGQYLYFMRDSRETVLRRGSLTTSELSTVLDGLLPQCSSCWALAPGGIYFLGSSSGSFDAQAIYYHDLATGKQREVVRYPEPLSPLGSGPFSLSPDHRYLLCVRQGPSQNDLMRIDSFR